MGQLKLSPRIISGIIVALFFGIALYLRTALPYDQVFSDGWIKFTGVDGYYHMRLVENLLQNFPQRITFDPYTYYPYGTAVFWPPFFDWFVAATTWVFTLGATVQQGVYTVAAYLPAVLGALTVIPVYFIGRELFSRRAGVIAAGLVAIYPGEFLGRTILGFTDHHAAETLFTTILMLFLILAIKTARERQLNFTHLKNLDRATCSKPLIYSLLAGITLGVYLLSWPGGLLFVFLISAYLVIQFIIDHLRGRASDYLAIVGTVCMVAATVVSIPVLAEAWLSRTYLASMLAAMVIPMVLYTVSRLVASRVRKPVFYPLTLVVGGLAGLGLFRIIRPELLNSILSEFWIFNPGSHALTISEVQPFLFPGGNFSLSPAWSNFTTGFYLGLISLGILIYLSVRRDRADLTLFLTWSLLILAATLGQRRFAYYFVVNVGLLTGYLSGQIIRYADFSEIRNKLAGTSNRAKRKRARQAAEKGGVGMVNGRVTMALGITVVFFLSFFPNIGAAIDTASQARFAPNDAWCETLSWLKENSPEPFDDANFYYERYEKPFEYPESAYGVIAAWEIGHWITQIAHRIPISNPFQKGIPSEARFFTAQGAASARDIMERLDAKYIILDNRYVNVDKNVSTFINLTEWGGGDVGDYLGIYYRRNPQDGKLLPYLLYHPEYYRSLCVRLYSFNGKAVTPESCMVIAYEERITPDGEDYKEVTGSKSFATYEEARAYIESQTAGNYQIAGNNPAVSCVPLKKLKNYELVYESEPPAGSSDAGTSKAIKIFEYTK